MVPLCKDSIRHQARIYKQKLIAAQALEDVKKIAYSCIGSRGDFITEEAPKGEVFHIRGNGGENTIKGYKWKAQLKVHDESYLFVGNSELHIWCNLISRLLGEQDFLYFPSVD